MDVPAECVRWADANRSRVRHDAMETPEGNDEGVGNAFPNTHLPTPVVPTSDLGSWRSQFHPGYAHGELHESASTSMSANGYTPNASTVMGPPAPRRPDPTKAHSREDGRGELVCAPKLEPVSEDVPEGADAVHATDQPCTTRYETSVLNAEAWANALLEASRSQTKKKDRGKKRRKRDGDGGTGKQSGTSKNPNTAVHDTAVSPKLCITRELARRALGTSKILEALVRRSMGGNCEASENKPSEYELSLGASMETQSEKESLAPMDTDTSEQTIEPVTPLELTIGYQGDFLTVPIETVNTKWTGAPFEPVGQKKDVTCVCLAPTGQTRAATETVREIAACYAAMRLGIHETCVDSVDQCVDRGMGIYPGSAFEYIYEYDGDGEPFHGITKSSLDHSLGKVADEFIRLASDGPCSLMVYVIGGALVSDPWTVTTYCTVVCNELINTKVDGLVCAGKKIDTSSGKIDFLFVPRSDAGCKNITPQKVREIAVASYRRATRVRRAELVVDSLNVPKQMEETEFQDFKRCSVLARNVSNVSRKDPRLASFDPLVVLAKESEGNDTASSSDADTQHECGTHCAYATSTVGAVTWVVATWTDTHGEALETDARAFTFKINKAGNADVTLRDKKIASWLMDRSVEFAKGLAVSAGDAASDAAREWEQQRAPQTEQSLRAARRASVFFPTQAKATPSTQSQTSYPVSRYARVAICRVGKQGAWIDFSLERQAQALVAGDSGYENHECHDWTVVLCELADARLGLTSLRVRNIVTSQKEESEEVKIKFAKIVGFLENVNAFFANSAAANAVGVRMSNQSGEIGPDNVLIPPHVRTCVTFAQTLRELETIAARGGDET